MKKFWIIGTVLFITGCGSSTIKTLNCSTTTEKDGMKVDINVESKWENDTLNTLKLETFYQLEKSLTVEEKNSFKIYVDSTMSSWNDMSGVKYDSSMQNSQFFMSLNIEASKGKKALTEFGIEVDKVTYESLKQSLEEENYICK